MRELLTLAGGDQGERFLDDTDDTNVGDDAEVVRDLAARGAPLCQDLAQARADRYRLGTLNPGSREYADTAAALAARYQRIYGGR